MKIVLADDSRNTFGSEGFRKALGRKMNAPGGCEVLYLPGGRDFPADITGELKKLSADILVTVNLQGFEQCTLTDNIAYNLADCKQIHLLLQEHLEREHFLSKQLSISMFFYCRGDAYYEHLRNTYPNMPYLKKIPEWGAEDSTQAESIFSIIREVMAECGNAGGRRCAS